VYANPGPISLRVPGGTPAASPVEFAVPGLRMLPEAPDGCQGASFTVALTLGGRAA